MEARIVHEGHAGVHAESLRTISICCQAKWCPSVVQAMVRPPGLVSPDGVTNRSDLKAECAMGAEEEYGERDSPAGPRHRRSVASARIPSPGARPNRATT